MQQPITFELEPFNYPEFNQPSRGTRRANGSQAQDELAPVRAWLRMAQPRWPVERELLGEFEDSTSTAGFPLFDMVNRTRELAAIGFAILQGQRNESPLTDMVFYQRHPERQGRRLARDDPQFAQLSAEWQAIRDQLVRPLLRFGQGGTQTTTGRCVASPNWPRELLPLLNRHRGDIPLDFLLGWVAVESGGKICDLTSMNERGYFQLEPDESKSLNLDHQRLSTDPDYSIQGGVALVRYYARLTQQMGFTYGTDLFWHIVKLWHWTHLGTQAIVDTMKQDGFWPKTWDEFQHYVSDNLERIRQLMRRRGRMNPQAALPPKWEPLYGIQFVNRMYAQGRQIAARLGVP